MLLWRLPGNWSGRFLFFLPGKRGSVGLDSPWAFGVEDGLLGDWTVRVGPLSITWFDRRNELHQVLMSAHKRTVTSPDE